MTRQMRKEKSASSSLPLRISIIVTAGNAKMAPSVSMALITMVRPVTPSVLQMALISTIRNVFRKQTPLSKTKKRMTIPRQMRKKKSASFSPPLRMSTIVMAGNVKMAPSASMALTETVNPVILSVHRLVLTSTVKSVAKMLKTMMKIKMLTMEKTRFAHSSLPLPILTIVTAGNAKTAASASMASIIMANYVILYVHRLASTFMVQLVAMTTKMMKILTAHSSIRPRI